METYFATAKRSLKKELIIQNKELISLSFATELMNASNNFLIILNEYRQIILANKKFLNLLGISEDNVVTGKRFGEAINCKNSTLMDAGCGTSEFCTQCGALYAILQALDGKECENECRINTIENDSIDLDIKAKPFIYKDTKYVIISALDISDTKRREILERVFFHDILNTAGGLYGLSEILKIDEDDITSENIDIIYNLSDKLIKEIQSHRMLLNAENGNLLLTIDELNLHLYLNMITDIIKNNQAIKHVNITTNVSESIYFSTDATLLQRVLINMIKNAAEASDAGDVITLVGEQKDEKIRISVHNPKFIPRETQLQIFQRSFSTKGTGRGIGTYSMKLFGENYLKGKVWFQSDEITGTTFFIEIPIIIN